MRCAVTGGAGFIGSHLTEALLQLGHRVTVIDDLFSGKRGNLAELETTHGDRLRFLEASVLDAEAVATAVDGAGVVFHLAAVASVPRSFADPGMTLRVNVEGTAGVLDACRRHGVRRFVFSSSSSVYGDTDVLPKHEQLQPAPLSPYALSKYAGERLLGIWHEQYGLETTGLRYFNIFGPRQDPASEYAAVVPRFVTRMLSGDRPVIHGDGLQSRDFTFVGNAVAANLLAAGFEPPGTAGVAPLARAADRGADVVNIGAGARATLLELVTAINRILGTDIEPEFTAARPGDVRHSQADVELARERIGYAPTTGFQEGLEATVSWFQARKGAPVG